MQEYFVDLTSVTSWEEFISAFNEGFVHHLGDTWKGNLDSFNDYLYWPGGPKYQISIRGWTNCAPLVNRKLAPDGRPVLDVVTEIFSDNPHATIIFVD